MRKVLEFVTYPFVSGSRDSNVGIVSVEDVERSPIFALTDIRPAWGFLLLISMVSFLGLFSPSIGIDESLALILSGHGTYFV